MHRSIQMAALGAMLLVATACPKPAPAPSAEPAAAPAEPAAPAAPSAEELAAKAAAERIEAYGAVCYHPAQCLEGEGEKEITIGGAPWKHGCWKLTAPAGTATTLNIGLIADIKANLEDNLKAFTDEYLPFFEKQKVDAIVVAGDSGETDADAIAAVWEPLLKTGKPVLTITGNNEDRTAYGRAVLKLQETYPNLINLQYVRLVQFPAGAVVGLGGYHDADFIRHSPGCVYGDDQIAELEAVVKQAAGPVALVTHGPPRGKGEKALDYAVNAGNVGDEKLAAFIKKADIPFGLFSNILEASGRAAARDADFGKIVKPGQASPTLYINVGPADTTPWTMNDGTINHGTVAVLSIDAKKKKGTANFYRRKPAAQGGTAPTPPAEKPADK